MGKNIQRLRRNNYIFRETNPEGICHKQTCAERNTKGERKLFQLETHK